MSKDHGGSAFPCPVGHIECAHPEGMSLRDYFAAKAIQGMATSAGYQGLPWDMCAREAYAAADAMLKERVK